MFFLFGITKPFICIFFIFFVLQFYGFFFDSGLRGNGMGGGGRSGEKRRKRREYSFDNIIKKNCNIV